ncbi:MAG: Rpp14/Pop5 family protein [Candidatus Micrarchaeales archaeon]|nr:Rpp14/Pop5 family protein [Candidatus Micrarchaeales archaeon]
MRDKQRYVLVESNIPIGSDERALSDSVSREVIRCIGEMNYHRVNPKMMKILGEKRFIMRSSLEGAGQLVLALSLIKRLNGSDIAFYTLKTSGTIKTLLQYKG